MNTISIREYGLLTTEDVLDSLDLRQISSFAFKWLEDTSIHISENGAPFVVPVMRKGRRGLQVKNYVGVIETPCGCRIEILPKVTAADDCLVRSRKLLERMILVAFDISSRQFEQADLKTFNQPLLECLMSRFLQHADHVVKRGVRREYQQQEEQKKVIRGQWQLHKQARRSFARWTTFDISHDIYTANRPENRVLRYCLDWVRRNAKNQANRQLATELENRLSEVPVSRTPASDLSSWQYDRLMAHYQPVKPWCDLIVQKITPFAFSGNYKGVSLLFPMEQLFESFVAKRLASQLHPGWRLKAQVQPASLCIHQDKPWFRLKPDIGIYRQGLVSVLDTKWKQLDKRKSDSVKKYGLSQSDFYQMFAYGQQCLAGSSGDMLLIYPATENFDRPLPVFNFSESLRLWVVPFDMYKETLVAGEWSGSALWYKH